LDGGFGERDGPVGRRSVEKDVPIVLLVLVDINKSLEERGGGRQTKVEFSYPVTLEVGVKDGVVKSAEE
jgi:hypothetical protein